MADAIQVIIKKFQKNAKDKTVEEDLKAMFKNAPDSARILLNFVTEAEKLKNKFLLKNSMAIYEACRKANELQNENMGLDLQMHVYYMLNEVEEIKKPEDKPTSSQAGGQNSGQNGKNGFNNKRKRNDRKPVFVLPPIRKLLGYFGAYAGAFKLNELPLEQNMKNFLSERDYVSAGALLQGGSVTLRNHFSDMFSELIVPIFITSKLSSEPEKFHHLISKLLKISKNEKRLFDFLDECLVKSKAEKEALVAQYGFSENAFVAFDDLKKCMTSLIKKSSFRKHEFLNLSRETMLDELFYRFVLYKYKKEMSQRDFEDHGRVAMQQGEWLQKAFIKKLIQHREVGEASKWARCNDFYKRVDKNEAPFGQLDLDPNNYYSFLPAPAAHPDPYHLDGFKVHFRPTSTAQEIDSITEILKNLPPNALLTLDCEFQSAYVSKCENKVSLLQFATHDKAYVVDCHSMDKQDPKIHIAWKRFLEAFFTSEETRIFGLGLWTDISFINNSFPELSTIKKTKIVDSDTFIKNLGQELKGKTMTALTKEVIKGGVGLKTLSRILFPLEPEMDKSLQMSAFDQRPLRKEQLDYAARDAIVLQRALTKLRVLLQDEHGEEGAAKFDEWLEKSEHT
ncbi:hypothetical protein L596_021972 [Steinernema carpocapsae]|uniref:3'-5' exonuclease domain-containing protein n=1 Tax=Steinernema carpocapsae TaxID=34508 RepID=A0A4U5MKB7_STECR|nr:hypothetical protein L596_021972 [Steinernema carpocapsae]